MLSKTRGFTLIEMMIVMVLMAAITTMVSITIRNAVKNKQKLEYRITHQAHLYDAIRIIRADVERAFHYQDVFYEIEKRAIDELNEQMRKQASNLRPGQPPPEPIPLPPQAQQLTHFLGNEGDLHFTTLNNYRTKFNAQESDQMEVGYFLSGCTDKISQKATRCLFRRSSPYIDDDVSEGGRNMMVAQHVTQLQFQYRSDAEDAEWVNQWRSDNRGRADHINKFPHQVKMNITIHNQEDKDATPLKETVVMNIHFPNNEPLFRQQGQNPNGRRN